MNLPSKLWMLTTEFVRTNNDYEVLRFKHFQGNFTSNSKTSKSLFCFQGLSRSWKNDYLFSRSFKDFQGRVATLILDWHWPLPHFSGVSNIPRCSIQLYYQLMSVMSALEFISERPQNRIKLEKNQFGYW